LNSIIINGVNITFSDYHMWLLNRKLKLICNWP